MSGATSEVEDTKNDDIQKYDVGKRKGSVVFLLDSSATKTQSAQSTNPELNENEDSSALPSDSKQSTDECNSGSSTATKGRCKEVPVVIISEAEFYQKWHIYDHACNKKNYPKLLLTTAVFLCVFFAIRLYEAYAHPHYA